MGPGPVKSDVKWGFWGAVVAATIGATALILVNWDHVKHIYAPEKKQISGIVSDERTKGPLTGIVVQLQSLDGKPLRQDTTDTAGRYSLEIPDGVDDIRIDVTTNDYYAYDQKLTSATTKNDVRLRHLPITFGIPDNTPLEKALEIVAGKLNVKVVFSSNCGERARGASVGGVNLEAEPEDQETVLKALLNHVNGNTVRYRVTTIESRGRYEVTCF
jgi:hypothetical protein